MIKLNLNQHLATGEFFAMASPCQILLDTDDWALASNVLHAVVQEVWRIEAKYSRYRADSVVSRINIAEGSPVAIDDETHRLLSFAGVLYDVSEGLFDISSGVLRKAWKFDGSHALPTQSQIDALLPLIGWHRANVNAHRVTLPKGMEIDLGGIGKEYAVDTAFDLISSMCDCACVVNFGGDLRTHGPRLDGALWQIGIEHPDKDGVSVQNLSLGNAAVATSGDARRFLLKDGVRYGHLLNPKTGWPVQGIARSITVLADTCTTAGMLSSLALLQGVDAQEFLEAQANIEYWLTV